VQLNAKVSRHIRRRTAEMPEISSSSMKVGDFYPRGDRCETGEPTSVGMLRAMVVDGDLTILMITHKFREVIGFADEVTDACAAASSRRQSLGDDADDMARPHDRRAVTVQPPASARSVTPGWSFPRSTALGRRCRRGS